MGQTLTNITIHIIFSTKDRVPFINQEIKKDLLAYLGGIIKKLNANPLIINGMSDHMHILTEIPPTLSVSELMRVVKTNSSRWIHQNYNSGKDFAWQDGYAAFSVSKSAIQTVISYIENQEKHHQNKSFQNEFIAFLKKYNVPYDEKYIWN